MEFLTLCKEFIFACATMFQITVPGLSISFFQLWCAIMIIGCVILGIKIIFGIDHGGDKVSSKGKNND